MARVRLQVNLKVAGGGEELPGDGIRPVDNTRAIPTAEDIIRLRSKVLRTDTMS